MDDASETALKADLDKLLAHVTRRKRFREVRAVVYYDREARSAEDKNKAVDTEIMRIIAKEGRTIAVPATIGPKFDQHMGLAAWIGRKFSELNIVYLGDELLPHPNVLLWVKKTANGYVPAVRNEIGVVIMPHGAAQPWNDAVERVIAPLTSRYRIEMALRHGRFLDHPAGRIEVGVGRHPAYRVCANVCTDAAHERPDRLYPRPLPRPASARP